MEKKAKIIATLGPAIYSENKLKKLVELGVDAFRINFSHNTIGISRIISKIRKIEKKIGKPSFETERDIFDFLDYVYKEPKNRKGFTVSKMKH